MYIFQTCHHFLFLRLLGTCSSISSIHFVVTNWMNIIIFFPDFCYYHIISFLMAQSNGVLLHLFHLSFMPGCVTLLLSESRKFCSDIDWWGSRLMWWKGGGLLRQRPEWGFFLLCLLAFWVTKLFPDIVMSWSVMIRISWVILKTKQGNWREMATIFPSQWVFNKL